MSSAGSAPSGASAKGMRKNGMDLANLKPHFFLVSHANTSFFGPAGKNWHDTKRPFRPTSGLTSYAKRQETRKQQEAIKEHEKELRDEKEAERQVRGDPSHYLHEDSKGGRPFCPSFTDLAYRRISKESRIAERRRRRKNATTRWPRKCTTSGLSD